jgi:hypothetical protein
MTDDPTLGGLLGPLPKMPKLPATQSRATSTPEVGGHVGGSSDVNRAGGAGEPAPGRLEKARAEIMRRRAYAETARATGWVYGVRAGDEPTLAAVRAHIEAASLPSHVLQVLAAADATLDRHGPCPECFPHSPDPHCEGDGLAWPCPDAAAVLDLYAPEAPDDRTYDGYSEVRHG